MTLTVESSSTQTTVIGTEHTLATPSTSQCRLLRIDRGAMVAGDTIEVRLKSAVLAAGAVGDQLYQTYFHAPGVPIVETIPVTANQGLTVTLKQTAGAAKAYPWTILTTGLVPAVESSGTQTAVIGTSHTLAAPSTNKTRVLRVDLAAMASGDILELHVQTPVLAAGTLRDQYYQTFANTLGVPIIETVPVSSNQGATFILKQTAGTGRAYPWCVLTLD